MLPCMMNTLSAKSKEDWQNFAKTAEKYEALAKKYEKIAEELLLTDPEKASIYKKVSENYEDMADIKDDAARMAKRGKWGEINWKDYEEIAKQNEGYLKVMGEGAKKNVKAKAMDENEKSIKEKIKHLEHQLELERKKLENK